MGNTTKPLLERLQTCLKLSGYKKTLAVCMYGLGYGSQDVAEETGLAYEEAQALRNGHQRTIKAITKQPDVAQTYLVHMQRDRAILKGFALSHDTNTTPRDLANIARTAISLSKHLEAKADHDAATPPATRTAPKPPPARPA